MSTFYSNDQQPSSSSSLSREHPPSAWQLRRLAEERQQQGQAVSLSDSGHGGPTLQRAPSSATRLDAIARLKRAASNRELKDAKPTEQHQASTSFPTSSPEAAAEAHSNADDDDGRRDGRARPTLSVQPVSPGYASQDQSSFAPSPAMMDRDQSHSSRSQRSGGTSPVLHMNLSRSASASRAESRSPLPSLEQLRSRILHERLAAGLQRSASASAASAAARAYAMNKLLGADATTREGATSPVSDSAHGRPGTIEEDDEERDEFPEDVVQSDGEGDDASKRRSRRTGNQYLRPPSMRNSAHFRSLRRSRTMSNLSQRADEERKAAFQKDLDLVEEGPGFTSVDGESGTRRRKRMSRLPQRKSGASSSGDPSTPRSPATPRTRLPQTLFSPRAAAETNTSAETIKVEPMPALQAGSLGLQRQPSHRELARAEMMRKLSGRRPGGHSPIPPRATSSRTTNEMEDDPLDSPTTPASDAPPALKIDEAPMPAFGDVAPGGDLTTTNLTPEQQMAFLQMQQLLQEQQLQLQQAAAAAASADGAATVDSQGSYGRASEAFEDDEVDLEEEPESLAAGRSPRTPEMASVGEPMPSTGTADQPLSTPSSSYDSRGMGSLDAARGKTSFESPGGASLFGNHLIPSMHFTPRARGSLSVHQEWPTSPVSSTLGFGDSDDVPVGERSAGSVEQNMSRLAVQDPNQDRSAPTLRQRNGSAASQVAAPSSTSNGLSASHLSPMPHRHMAVPSSTPSSMHSNFSPNNDASFSRLSHATSAGGDHFVYDSLLTSSGGRSSSALGNMSFSPGPGGGNVLTYQQQLQQHQAEQSQRDRSQKPGTVATPGDPFSQEGRIQSWREWMSSQGMEVPDLESPLQRRGAGAAGQQAGGKPRLDLPLLDTSSIQRRPLAVDISPSLVQEYGADIEWPGQLADLQARNAGQDASAMPSKPVLTPETERNVETVEPRVGLNRNGHAPHLGEPASSSPPQGRREQFAAPASQDQQQQFAPRPRPPAAPERSSSIRSTSVSEQQRMRSASRASEHDEGGPSYDSRHRRATDASIPEGDEGARASPAQMLVESFRAREQVSPSTRSQDASSARPPPSAWAGGSTADDAARPLYRTMHHRVPSATDVETQTAYSNTKLTPFPGLLPRGVGAGAAGAGRVTPLPAHAERGATPTSLADPLPPTGLKLARKTSALSRNAGSPSPSPSPMQYANAAGVTAAPSGSAVGSPALEQSASSRSLFGSLRRKASAAMRNGSLRRKASNQITPFDLHGSASTASSAMGSPQSTNFATTPTSIMTNATQGTSGGAIDRKPSRTLRFQDSPAVTPAAAAAPEPAPTTQPARIERTPSTRAKAMGGPQPDLDVRRQAVVVPGTSATDQLTPQSERSNPIPYTAVRVVRQTPSHSRNESVASLESTSNGKQTPRAGLPPIAAEESLDSGEATPTTTSLAPKETSQLEPRTVAMLQRASRILTSPLKASPTSPGVPGVTAADVEAPPRQLLKVSPVFQVVSSSTIKDRFLILFDDILVVAKPLAPPLSYSADGAVTSPDIRWTFVVKSIIEVRHLSITTPKEGRYQLRKHPLQDAFVASFAHNPEVALADIVRRSGLPNNAQTMAQLLVQTPGLDKAGMTRLLSHPAKRDVLDAFVKMQRVTGVSIESALRSVLLELRFPSDAASFEALLLSFASHWVDENKELIKRDFTNQLAADLTFAVMALNDALHGRKDESDEDLDEDDDDDSILGSEESSPHLPGYRAPGFFSEPMSTLSKSAFISAFREHDPQQVLSDRTLLRIYSSVKLEPIQQAFAREEEDVSAVCDMHGGAVSAKPIWVDGPGLPLKLVYGVTSDPITLCIDEPDAGLSVRLYGQDLQFDPPILSFETSSSRSFTVTSRALGVRHAVFVRAGRNARLYCGTVGGADATPEMRTAAQQGKISDLPKSLPLTVERAFMQTSFTLTATATGAATESRGGTGASSTSASPSSKRKFMFSVNDAVQRQRWVDLLTSTVQESLHKRAELQRDLALPASNAKAVKAKATKAASTLALHVLRQALITSTAASKGGTPKIGQGKLNGGSAFLDAARPALGRNTSVSHRYYAAGAAGTEERELAPASGASVEREDGDVTTTTQDGAGTLETVPDEDRGAMTGEEIITVCKQNSLLPLVLEGGAAAGGSS